MPEIFMPKRSDVLKIAGVAAVAVAYVAGTRRIARRYINGAERLANALLDTDKLKGATDHLAETTEKALAACASYLVGVAYHAAQGVGTAGPAEDPVGYSRRHEHPYSHASATVLTEANSPEQILTYSVTIPDLGDVRGTRRIGGMRISGLAPARPANDTVQVSLADGYTAQLESEFEVGEYLYIGAIRLFGPATLRDNRGNVGRLNIGYDGTVAGTITRDGRVIGRFEGKTDSGLQFRQYQIEAGD